MSKIFLSLSSADQIFAKRLADSLLYDFGAEVWAYFKDNLGSLKWSTGVQQGLDDCSLMVLIVSSAAIDSENVENEWHYYLEKKKPIILVEIASVDLPFELIRRPRLDFQFREYTEAFEDLCVRLQAAGIEPNRVSTPIKINRSKTGNLFWLCHDMMELYRWLIEGIPKQWLDVGLRQSYHHARELGLDEEVYVVETFGTQEVFC